MFQFLQSFHYHFIIEVLLHLITVIIFKVFKCFNIYLLEWAGGEIYEWNEVKQMK